MSACALGTAAQQHSKYQTKYHTVPGQRDAEPPGGAWWMERGADADLGVRDVGEVVDEVNLNTDVGAHKQLRRVALLQRRLLRVPTANHDAGKHTMRVGAALGGEGWSRGRRGLKPDVVL